ncbi:winged helix-turn-helix transcriptional regulator [Halapricum sp. CBA1109]|uniref:Lrp/AsnC family transcriptional regulator n=1 Tax=Halapricum sp. CBA1109 TaxID=2668068 RepID=UPI0012F92F54|nr:Lrp/AsnC family transcriptional regulator [Halapricum sp. CBA1109]MUV89750.1 winged helix-turn-helix transcriptional regulator [Halapricum sp. CBA1109]
MELDEIDKQVVDALVEDGRATDRDIAAATGIVANRVSERRDSLEESGLIEGYTPLLDYDRLGYDVTAVFQLAVEGDGLDEVIAKLGSLAGITTVYEVTGDHDIVAVGKFTDTASMDERIKDLLTDDNVRSVSTSVVLNVVQEDAPLTLQG